MIPCLLSFPLPPFALCTVFGERGLPRGRNHHPHCISSRWGGGGFGHGAFALKCARSAPLRPPHAPGLSAFHRVSATSGAATAYITRYLA